MAVVYSVSGGRAPPGDYDAAPPPVQIGGPRPLLLQSTSMRESTAARKRYRPIARAVGLIAVAAMAPAMAMAQTAAPLHGGEDESDRIAELLELGPGMHVADIGAGDGEFGEAMARRVGESGHVYLNEVDDGELIKLRDRLERSELGNMSVVVGTVGDANLPPVCVDAILLRLVYHHLSHPAEMRASLRRSLCAAGLLLVVEMDDEGHGTPLDRLKAEWGGEGFEVVSEHPGWHDHDSDYAVLFRRSD